MRVTVLGGSAACPNPRQGCSGYLVSDGDVDLLIDCGPGVLPELLAHIGLDDLDGVLISHLHQDHVLDLVPLRYGLKYAPGIERRRIPVWVPPGGQSFFVALGNLLARGSEADGAFFDEAYEFLEYDPSASLRLASWQIRFHRTRHWIPCWAIRLESPLATIVYTADTGWDDDLVSFAHRADLLIVEATLPDDASEAERTGHLTSREAGRLAAFADVRRVVVTHYWAGPDLNEQLACLVREFGRPVEVARPGLTVVLTQEESP
jgi:ribonuclease BN (tRNA processing enzyme)